MFIAAGPDIKPCRADPVSVMDVTPTALHLLGLSVPQDMDGRVLVELLSGDAAARQVSRSCAAHAEAPAAAAEPAMSADEQRLVEERLRDLGYMD